MENYKACERCGMMLPLYAKFCSRCGQKSSSFSPDAGNQTPQKPPYEPVKQPVIMKDGKYHSKRKSKVPGVIFFILVLAALGIGAYSYKDTILKSIRTIISAQKSDSDPGPVLSGSKAMDIQPGKGIRLTASANALDKGRTFTVTKLNDIKLAEIYDKFSDVGIPLIGFDIDAGMGENERFPGEVAVHLNLKDLEVPLELHDSLNVARVGADGKITILNSSLKDGEMVFFTRQNSAYILFPLLLYTLKVAHDIEANRDKYMNGSYISDIVTINNATWAKSQTYRLYWPDTFKPQNYAEVKAKDDQLAAVYKRHGFKLDDSRWVLAQKDMYSEKESFERNRMKKLKEVELDPDYIKLQDEMDLNWKKNNLWPKEVLDTYEALKKANIYLFDVQKLKLKNYGMDIVLLKKWPLIFDQKALAYAQNLKLGYPYIHINASNAPLDTDELNITLVHELFHTLQNEYYNIHYDYYSCFFEAAAVSLEYQANDYYVSNGWNKKPDILTDRDYWETLANKLDDDNDAEIIRMHHGYTASLFLDFLRDQKNFFNGSKTYIKLLMEAFSGYFTSPTKAYYVAGGKTAEELSNAFIEFIKKQIPVMYQSISHKAESNKKITDPAEKFPMVDGIKSDLTESKPFDKWSYTEKQLSAELRIASLEKIPTEVRKNSVVVVYDGVAASMKSRGVVTLSNTDGEHWRELSQRREKVPGDTLKEISLCRICPYVSVPGSGKDETWIFVMLQPKVPQARLEGNKLIIEIPASVLRQNNLVNYNRVTIELPGATGSYKLDMKGTKAEFNLIMNGDQISGINAGSIPDGESITLEKMSQGAEDGMSPENSPGIKIYYREIADFDGNTPLTTAGPYSPKVTLNPGEKQDSQRANLKWDASEFPKDMEMTYKSESDKGSANIANYSFKKLLTTKVNGFDLKYYSNVQINTEQYFTTDNQVSTIFENEWKYQLDSEKGAEVVPIEDKGNFRKAILVKHGLNPCYITMVAEYRYKNIIIRYKNSVTVFQYLKIGDTKDLVEGDVLELFKSEAQAELSWVNALFDKKLGSFK